MQRVWREHGLQPHRLERHLVSNDPDFETKAADVIGLYLNPPAHAAVFCVDEKTAIQALDRKDRMLPLPLAPGRAEGHGFEYKRNGTPSLFAALNTATGEALGMPPAPTPASSSSASSATLSAVSRETHVICDNVSSHKTELVQAFLPEHANVRIHYTPIHSSWLIQVENWFSRIQRDVISRGILTSLKDLDKKAHVLHPSAQQGPKAAEVEVRQSPAPTPTILLIQWTSRPHVILEAPTRLAVQSAQMSVQSGNSNATPRPCSGPIRKEDRPRLHPAGQGKGSLH